MIKGIVRRLELYWLRKQQKLHLLQGLGKPTFISRTASFAFQQNITIGRYCRIGKDNRIDGEGGLTIGDGTILAPRVVILTSSHNYQQSAMLPYDNTDKKSKVTIGRGVWLGWGSVILPGVDIGDGAVIAAGSVVAKSVEKGQVVGGNPASLITERLEIETIDRMVANDEYCLKHVIEGELVRSGRQKNMNEIVR